MADLSFTFPTTTAGVTSVNAVTGAVLVTGTQNLTSETNGQTVTLRGPDLTSYASTSALVTTSGYLQEQIDDGADPFPALVGSDGIVVTSGNPDVVISGFYSEFVNASGSLSSEIDDDIGIHASTSDAHHTRYQKSENDAIVAGANIVVTSGSNTITIASTASGQIANALVGSDGITVSSGVSEDTISGFYTEFTNASGSLSSEIDGDIATHAAISDAHHSRYTDGEAVSATEASRYALSGTLSAEIDSDISTHTSDASAHHTRYQKNENDAITGSDGITVTSGSNTVDVQGFYAEFVGASGSLDYKKVDRSGDTMWGDLDIQNTAGLTVGGDATVSGQLTVGSGGDTDSIINWKMNGALTYVMGIDGGDEDRFKIATSEGLGLGSCIEIETDGTITTVKGLYPDGGFYPRRLSQNEAPTSGTGDTQIDGGELLVWYDTVGSGTHLLFNDPVQGVVTWSGVV